VGEIDSNGWPPKPDLDAGSIPKSKEQTANVSQSIPAKYTQICQACHSINGKGGNVGPTLDKVGSKYDADYLTKWLKDPQAVKPGTNMPKLPLTDPELAELVLFLSNLK
jgi:nitric oxide reductase subunit C